MTSYTRWQDIRAGHVARVGGEEAVRAGKDELRADALLAREAPAPSANAPGGHRRQASRIGDPSAD
ncbi:DNA-binding protein [Streptomyces sp. AJ-1]|uniref:DNA-binding protein n=1 Tax=Streptomyces sp. AJ-1 TaxID=3044384 RepID=UPI00249ACEAF|nr:DNA-binding protein [Streptomyces sp. AJ-1]MDI3346747.1 DNA-binding protein [Streptomyces sp. AJ-1]